jgi:hypothetical protein
MSKDIPLDGMGLIPKVGQITARNRVLPYISASVIS